LHMCVCVYVFLYVCLVFSVQTSMTDAVLLESKALTLSAKMIYPVEWNAVYRSSFQLGADTCKVALVLGLLAFLRLLELLELLWAYFLY
jgi:hypothetical protein